MLDKNCENRISIDDILKHEWLTHSDDEIRIDDDIYRNCENYKNDVSDNAMADSYSSENTISEFNFIFEMDE